jgi:hypothetical protein
MSSSQGRAGRGQQYVPGQQQQAGYQQPGYQQGYEPERGGGGAVAGSLLAGVLMIMSGLFGFLSGLAMIVRRSFFTNSARYPYHWSTTGWGWLELILGIVVFAAGVSVLFGMTWARVVGVILATFMAVSGFLTIPLFPLWGITLVAINAFIVWALVSRRRDYLT